MTITRDELLAEVEAATSHNALCLFAGCARPQLARGWCAAHYQQLKRRGDAALLTPIKPYAVGGQCLCGRRAVTQGLCSAHYNRQLRGGDPQFDKPLRPYRRADDET